MGTFPAPGAVDQYPPDRRLDIVHLDAALHVDVAGRSLDGTVTHTVRCRAPSDTLVLHAVDFESVEVEGADGSYDGRCIDIRFDAKLDVGDEREVTVRYRVVEPVTGLFFSRPTDDEPDLPWFAATDHETERARHWLPTIDHPSVRPTLRLRITAADRFTILANGVLEGEQAGEHDGTKTATWRLDQPCPSYLTCFVVGELARWDGAEHEGIPIAAFAAAPITATDLARTFGPTAEIMRWLTGRLGVPFPYPKYYQFAVPGIGGAMENISLVSWDDKYVLDETIEPEHRQRVDSVNVHEMAHSWFGDHVVIRDFADAWLKEGWATYLESCWLDETKGRDEMDYDLWVGQKLYLEEVEQRYRRSIVTRRFASSWELFDYHLYPGAAWRLHMLRRLLGDEAFWKGVQTYLERFGGTVADTDDFRRTLEEASGRSLGRFFDQWLRRPGYPKLKVGFERKSGVGRFEIEQTQAGDDAAPFAFALDLAWEIDGVRTVETVQVERARTIAAFPMAGEPTSIRIDPSGNVLHSLDFEPGEPMAKRQLAEPDVRGRIQAGLALVRSGRRSAVEAVREAYAKESFWGVRAAWAEALGAAGSEAALNALSAIASEETEPRVLAAVLSALGRYRDRRAHTALVAKIDSGLGPRAAEAAWEALGKQRDGAPLSKMIESSTVRGFGGFAQSGLFRGLAESRSRDAVDVLSARARDADPRARGAAAEALGSLARLLRDRDRERAIEALVDLLRAPDPRQRKGAAKGLVHARARDALATLEAFRASLGEQDAVLLDKDLAQLRRSDDTAAIGKSIDELEAKLRKLSDRVDELEANQDS